jgi:pantetheine-phosphate adenylyltransferase
MALDCADGQAGGDGDLGEVEFLDEAKQEDGALALGELGYGVPDYGQLFFGDKLMLERAVTVGNVFGYIRDVDCVGCGALPETKALGTGVVAKQVKCDAHEPCDDGAVFPEGGTGDPGAQECLLSESLGDVAVTGGDEEKAEDALLVKGDDGGQIVEGGHRGLVCCCKDFRDGGLGRHGLSCDRISVVVFHLLSGQTWGLGGRLQDEGFFSKEKGMLLMMHTVKAIYPGTFDPLTNGHLDLIARGSKIVDELVVAILRNSEKGTPLFTVPEREEMIAEAVRGFGNVSVTTFNGLLVDFARQQGAKAVLRGIRAISDYEYEFQMAMMNRKLDPELETLFMMPAEKYTYVSSRLIKGVFQLGGDVTALVPPLVVERLKAKVPGRV